MSFWTVVVPSCSVAALSFGFLFFRKKIANTLVTMSHPIPQPKIPGEFTREELKQFNGESHSHWPIYIGVNGKVYDVSSKRDMYEKGTGFVIFLIFFTNTFFYELVKGIMYLLVVMQLVHWQKVH